MICYLEGNSIKRLLSDGNEISYTFGDKPVNIHGFHDGQLWVEHPLMGNLFGYPENIYDYITYEGFEKFLIKSCRKPFLYEGCLCYGIPKYNSITIKDKNDKCLLWHSLLKVAWSFDLTIFELINQINEM